MKLHPLNGYVTVSREKQEPRTDGGIILTSRKDSEVWTVEESSVSDLSVGDKVVLGVHVSEPVVEGNLTYQVINAKDILVKVEG